MRDKVLFFSFNRSTDWAKGASANLEIADDCVHLQQVNRFGYSEDVSMTHFERPEDEDPAIGQTQVTLQNRIRRLVLGENGKLYLLDRSADLWLYDHRNKLVEPLFPIGHHMFTEEATLITLEGLVMVADPQGERKLAAYLNTMTAYANGQLVWQMDEWLYPTPQQASDTPETGTSAASERRPLYPLAMASDQADNLYVLIPKQLKRDSTGALTTTDDSSLVILKIKSSGEVRIHSEQPVLAFESNTPLDALQNRFFMALTAEGKLYVMDAIDKTMVRLTPQGELDQYFSLRLSFVPSGLAVDADGAFYLGDSSAKPEHEDTRFVLQFDRDGEFVGNVPGYQGKTDQLLIDTEGARMFVWETEEQRLTLLDMQPRTKVWEEAGDYRGVFLSKALDSTEPEMIWHKITLDADIPDETQLHVSYYASDDKEAFLGDDPAQNQTWTRIDDFLMNPKREFVDKLNKMDKLFQDTLIVNPKDALLLNAKGRYLWLRVELLGTEKSTPLIRRMRAYFPRTSYLEYLPAVYQEDEPSRDFLERFFSLFGTFFSEMEEKVSHISSYFDADSVSGEYLKWLSTWLGIAADTNWTDDQIRQLVKSAPELYAQRGTKQGLEQMIEIFTGKKPEILEAFSFQREHPQTELEAYMKQLYGQNPYSFCVLVDPDCVQTDKQRLMLQRIIEEEKPAFTDAKLVVLQQGVKEAAAANEEADTPLSEPHPVLDNKTTLSNSLRLIDVDLDNRLDQHARLDQDARLE